jgi:hypothetical protein
VVVAWEGPEPPPPSSTDVRYLDVFPGGLGNARNRGLAAATSELVCFVDDDEVVDEGWAKGLLTAFDRPPFPDGVFGAVAPADEAGTAYCRFDGSEDRIFRGAQTPPWYVGTGGNMAFRREVLLDAGGFDPTFGNGSEAQSADETELVLRLLRRGSTLVWTPDMRVYHPSKSSAERIASRRTYGYGMGRALRRQRRALTTARYLVQLGQVAAGAVVRRDRARAHEAATQFGSFMGGLAKPRTWLSPRQALVLAPPELRARLEAVHVVPLPAPDRPRPHLLYRVGPDRILHAYGSPLPTLRAALESRAQIELRGVPRHDVVAEGRDSIWVLEERLQGEHPDRRAPGAWFDRVCTWALELAGPPGPPLGSQAEWQCQTEAALRACPPELRRDLALAHDVVSALPAVQVHGDFSRKNVLVGDGSVGAVDWEDCALRGVPGRDVLLLAVGAGTDDPDAHVIVRLAQGESPTFGDLVGPLAQLGVAQSVTRDVLLTVLGGWAADEERRLSDPGATVRRRPYRDLLAECAGALTSRS